MMKHLWLPRVNAPIYLYADNSGILVEDNIEARQHNAVMSAEQLAEQGHDVPSGWLAFASWQALNTYFESIDTTATRKRQSSTSSQVCLYIGSQHFLSLQQPVSSAQIKQLGETGVRYLFEDLSLSSVDRLLIRHGSVKSATAALLSTSDTATLKSDELTQLYAISSDTVEQYQKSLALVGLTLSALLPDFLLMSQEEHTAPALNKAQDNAIQINWYQDKQTGLLRLADNVGLAVQAPELTLVQLNKRITEWQTANMSSELSESTQVTWKISGSLANRIAQQVADTNSQWQVLSDSESMTPLPTATALRHRYNFFKKEKQQSISPYLQVVMALFGLALLLQISYDGLQWYRYNQLAQQYDTLNKQQFLTWFPEEGRVTSLERQLKTKLTSGVSDALTIDAVLPKLTPVLKKNDMTASHLVFANDQLQVTVNARNMQSLNQVVESLKQQAVVATLGNVANNSGGVTGQIIIRSATS